VHICLVVLPCGVLLHLHMLCISLWQINTKYKKYELQHNTGIVQPGHTAVELVPGAADIRRHRRW